jgi:hypothetical protein
MGITDGVLETLMVVEGGGDLRRPLFAEKLRHVAAP